MPLRSPQARTLTIATILVALSGCASNSGPPPVDLEQQLDDMTATTDERREVCAYVNDTLVDNPQASLADIATIFDIASSRAYDNGDAILGIELAAARDSVITGDDAAGFEIGRELGRLCEGTGGRYFSD